MSSTTTHITKIFPKRADVTGSPEHAFHMLGDRTPYYNTSSEASPLVPLGLLTLGVLYSTSTHPRLPQVHHDLGGDPVGFVGISSNKIDKFSCVYIRLSDFKFFPFVEATSTMNELLKHTQVTPFASEHLTYTRDLKDLTDPVRGTFLPNISGCNPRPNAPCLCPS